MNVDDVFDRLRHQQFAGALDSDAIVAEALARRGARLSPATITAAGALALVMGLGAGIGGAQPASASPTLVALAYSPSNILLGD